MDKTRVHCWCGDSYVFVTKEQALKGEKGSCGDASCNPPVNVSRDHIDASETPAPQRDTSTF